MPSRHGERERKREKQRREREREERRRKEQVRKIKEREQRRAKRKIKENKERLMTKFKQENRIKDLTNNINMLKVQHVHEIETLQMQREFDKELMQKDAQLMIQNVMMQIMGVQFPGQGGTPGSGMGGNSLPFANRRGLGGPAMPNNVEEVDEEDEDEQNGPAVAPQRPKPSGKSKGKPKAKKKKMPRKGAKGGRKKKK